MIARRRILIAVATAGTFAVTASAHAATVELDSGSTKLKLDRGTARALDALGVAVSPVGPARAAGGGVRFPISGGAINPATGAGVIEHSGALQLRAGSTRVRLVEPRIAVGKRARLSVSVGGKRLHAFLLSLRRAKVTRRGLDTRISRVRVLLSAKGAAALNRAFGVHAFTRGLPIGTATVNAKPAQLAFRGGNTALALDPGTAAALTSLGVTAAPAAPATARADGSLAFPITGGKVDIKTLAGSIRHSGGITLSKGSTQVTVKRFVIETAPAPKLTAAVGSGRIDLATLDLGAAQTSLAGRRVTVSGVVAKLTQPAADALNQAFGTTAFTAGLTIGTATVSGRAA
jgi:hypothetical protein